MERPAITDPKKVLEEFTRTCLFFEPQYSLAIACELIPCRPKVLESLLLKYKAEFPARYFTASNTGRGGYRVRMLTLTECQRLREICMTTTRRGPRRPKSLTRIARELRDVQEEGNPDE